MVQRQKNQQSQHTRNRLYTSSAIAANLAKGFDLDASVKRAKDYISGALAAMLDLGKGSGPMNHAFDIQSKFTKENSEAEQ